MNDSLARKLLANITGWHTKRLTCERKNLQLLSEYKYDEYQQFEPGMRFSESLALWLVQFERENRELAYEFVKNKIIFVSTAELNHLIRMAYPDFIKHRLIEQFAQELGIESHLVKQITCDEKFKVLERECLFLGLSDGAHVDVLRRFAQLKHEQVYPTYSITDTKAKDLLRELRRDVKEITGGENCGAKYRFVFLIDDFSASGISYLRQEDEEFKGKISSFYKQMNNNQMFKEIFADNLKIYVVLYIATKKAKKYIEETAREADTPIEVIPIQVLDDTTSMDENDLGNFVDLMKEKFDKVILTRHYKKGKYGKPHMGFDECGLSVVLSHNCPNNSLPIMWHNSEQKNARALFPRFERH